MRISDLETIITYLNKRGEDMEIYLFNEETGVQEEFKIELQEEVFDGFDTLYPESLVIKRKLD